jgi:hypothetical protein
MLRLIFIATASFLLIWPPTVRGQEEEVSLGDIARKVRSERPDVQQPVIDNDNLAVMMDKAESERLNGKPVFSIDSSGKSFRMTSPDGSCSLSFDANATAVISTPYVSSSLPEEALARLEGEASIHGNTIEVSVHNATDWEVKEIVVGVTLLNNQGPLILKPANLLLPAGEVTTKTPDLTMLYHLKATAAPGESTVFRGMLDQDLGPNADWHWALVGARGVPPAAPSSVATPAATASTAPPMSLQAPLILQTPSPPIVPRSPAGTQPRH